MKICYVTGNKGKIELAKLIFKDTDVEIEQIDIDVPEIQSLDTEEVAKYSAEYASKLLNKPVLKNDSGLYVKALNGFPGALAKYAEENIGAEGYCRMLEGKEKECYWTESLAYAYPGEEAVVFTSKSYGKIADTPREGRGYPFDKIFIPENDDRTFSQMTLEEQLSYFNQDAYFKILEYIKNNGKD